MVADRLEHLRFRAKIPQEVLGKGHAAITGRRDTDEEDVGAGAAGETGGLGVEPGHGVPRGAGGATEVKRVAEGSQAVDAVERPGAGADVETVARGHCEPTVIARSEAPWQSPSERRSLRCARDDGVSGGSPRPSGPRDDGLAISGLAMTEVRIARQSALPVLPTSSTGPTHDGHPHSQPQFRTRSIAAVTSSSWRRNSRSASPTPPGARSYR